MENGPRKQKYLPWLIPIVLSILGLYALGKMGSPPAPEIKYSTFLDQIEKGNVKSVLITSSRDEIIVEFNQPIYPDISEWKGPERFRALPQEKYQKIRVVIMPDPNLVSLLHAKKIPIEVEEQYRPSPWTSLLLTFGLLVLPLVFIFYFIRRQKPMLRGPFNLGKSAAKVVGVKEKTTFNDVAGCEESKEELREIVEFLRNPGKFNQVGAKIPKGVLLMGPPGTGKTLLARAVAGESGCTFYQLTGSHFVEVFVGVGASRVRDLFEEAKKTIPCIIFIDEIDGVGQHRGAGIGGGHDEREQTLNQLLAEMDGFETRQSIIVMAASNRPDMLDPALLRAGRFDRQVVVPVPDIKGREAILKIHARNVPLDDSVDLGVIARSTPGFTGADLANLINEAAIFAARAERKKVVSEDFERARDKILMGVERKTFVMSSEEKKITAYHEAGHALLAEILRKEDPQNVDPVHRVTVIPRGMALGITMQLPQEDKYLKNKKYLLNMVCILLGGRTAEELTFGNITTGAAHDLKQVTEIARNMVTRWGMSDRLGTRTFGRTHETVFLGKEMMQEKDFSDQTAFRIDEEVSALIKSQDDKAKRLLRHNAETLGKLATALVEKETLTDKELEEIISV